MLIHNHGRGQWFVAVMAGTLDEAGRHSGATAPELLSV
jgi:hypothetical protein